MIFETSKSDLSIALQTASITLGVGSADLAGHFLFRLQGKELQILSYNARGTFSSTFCKSNVIEEGESFTIEGKRLKMWISALPVKSVITFSSQDGIVKASSEKGEVHFKSLDPESFPYWDKTLDEVNSTGSIVASRLDKALRQGKKFISEEESRLPNLCVIEAHNSVLFSSDTKCAGMVKLPGFDGTTLRVHYKNINSLLSYLSTFSTEEQVEILENERVVFYKRANNTIYGEQRFHSSFPTEKFEQLLTPEVELCHWDFPRKELRESIKFMLPATDLEDEKLVFNLKDEDTVELIKSSETGEDLVQEIKLRGRKGDKASRFTLSYAKLLSVIDMHEDDVLQFSIHVHTKDSGWVRIENQEDGDTCIMVLVWLR